MEHLFPFIENTRNSIESQYNFLRKISLVGKVNTGDFAENIFRATDDTIAKFVTIKDNLIESLLENNINKLKSELNLRAQLSIDVLKRNLFERTADVGFLATDSYLIDFLTSSEISEETIVKRLQEYVAKYSVYDDVALFDTEFNLKVNINPKNSIKTSSDSILQEAMESDSFVEKYRKSDIVKSKEKSLLYAQKIEKDRRTVGILVLSFKFDDELDYIFKNLSNENIMIFLEDSRKVISSSNHRELSVDKIATIKHLKDFSLYKKDKFAIQTETKGYQGYFGLDWKSYAVALKNKEEDIELSYKLSLPPKLKELIYESKELIEDLSNVIINGELIASKYKQYTLSPILESLRTISNSLILDINKSTDNLIKSLFSSLLTTTRIATVFAIDLMDRNLYERANDARWWALIPTFINELSNKENMNVDNIKSELKYINELYTVYTNIFIYDKSGTIIAASNDDSIVGTKISKEYVSQTLNNKDTQKYFVSQFDKSPLYGDKATYIYSAAINNEKSVIGGIGTVFDSEPEFKAILSDSALQNQNGFLLFCDRNKNIISSTNENLLPTDKIELNNKYFSTDKVLQEFIKYNEKNYLLTVAPSKGYREYKISDNYKNDVLALYFVEV
jgi:hypothetical protein